MGYISHIFVLDQYGLEVARFDLGKISYFDGFKNLFVQKFEGRGLYSLFGGMEIPEQEKKYYPNCDSLPDVAIRCDRYGDELTVASISDVYEWFSELLKIRPVPADIKAFCTFLGALTDTGEASDYTLVHFAD